MRLTCQKRARQPCNIKWPIIYAGTRLIASIHVRSCPNVGGRDQSRPYTTDALFGWPLGLIAVSWFDYLRLLWSSGHIIFDECLGHFTRDIVVMLHGGRLHQIRAWTFQGAADAAIQGQLHHT